MKENRETQKKVLLMMKAIANETRFEIVRYLLTNPSCITGNIVNLLPIAQATVSQHLKILRDAGWITGNAEGTSVSYCADKENIRWFTETVGKLF
jgi:ArsR family transcriptional regulator, arsenate/arsenite/antimonite-responsive transcriptional repressor